MFTVKSWNQFAINNGDEIGKLVITQTIEARNVTEALDEAIELAHNWNTEASEDMKVNFVTCRGFIRVAN